MKTAIGLIDPSAPEAEAATPINDKSIALSDVIFIRELKLDAHIGAYADERLVAQTLEFDLEIGLLGNPACTSDRLADTIDYAEVVAAIRILLNERKVHLLESLAESIADLLLQEFNAHWVSISIAKLGIVPGAQAVGVRIKRARRTAQTRAIHLARPGEN